MKSYISIHALNLIGVRKNYVIPFFPGVNIIYGDSDTGKSSILEFINYLLGASNIELADEVISSVEYAALEIEINGIQYTIKRNIFEPNEYIEVYQCIFSECNKNFPKKYAPNFRDGSAADGFFSDFLMDSLNFPKVKIKSAPTKVDSDVKRLGFRGVFKYVYINQDDVGSKNFLDLSNGIKATTNREVFKYIFNVLDSTITELEAEIALKSKEESKYLQKYNSVSEFLRETDYDSQISLDESISEVDEIVSSLEEELKTINVTMTSNSSRHQEIKSLFNVLSLNEKSLSLELVKTRDQIDKYSRLKNDYENDISKINSIILAQSRIGELTSFGNPCPVCDNLIESNFSPEFHVTEKSALQEEIESLKKRKKSIQTLIEGLSVKYKELNKDLVLVLNDINKAREMMDTESKVMITPYLTQRDTLIKEISKHSQHKVYLQNSLKIRNQQQKIHDSYIREGEAIQQLQSRLEGLREKAPKIDDVLSTLGDYLNKYLAKVNIKKRTEISISNRSFVPVIRGRDYYKITSGGLRTITSIGHFLSLLEFAIDEDINHPRLLMIDTVGKYLGKITKQKYALETNLSEDAAEGISDPMKYQNIYEYMLAIANRAEEKEVPCQIILVDNDVPETFINRYKAYIVAHYSSIGEGGLPLGLIDDLEPNLSNS